MANCSSSNTIPVKIISHTQDIASCLMFIYEVVRWLPLIEIRILVQKKDTSYSIVVKF